MKLRAATIADIPALVGIEAEAFGPSKYEAMSLRQFRRHVANPSAVLIVADLPPVAGYALGFVRKGVGYLRFYSLAVAAAQQGGIVGRELFSAIEAEATRRDLGLQCEIRADNAKLLTRYLAMGLKVYAQVQNYYPDGQSCIKLKREP